MRKNEVTIGADYFAKVSDKLVKVHVTGVSRHGGWDAINIATGRAVRIKSAQRLRGPAGGKPRAGADAAAPGIERTPQPERLTVAVAHDKAAGGDGGWSWSAREGKVDHYTDPATFGSDEEAKRAGTQWLAKYAKANDTTRRKMLGWKAEGKSSAADAPEPAKAAPAPKRSRKPASDGPKKLSLIDAAAQVLATAGQALNTKQMLDLITTEGLWSSPNGKTPAATLYSSILRELQTKGQASRFVKTERGKFIVNAAAVTTTPAEG